MMNPIYQVGDEKDIRAFVAFGKEADGKLYEDAEFKTQVEAAEAQNAFEKGMLLVDIGDAGKVAPVAFVSGSVIVLKYSEATDATETASATPASVAPIAFACKAAE